MKIKSYLLRDVEGELWRRVKDYCLWNDITIKDFILESLDEKTKQWEKERKRSDRPSEGPI